MANKMRWRWGKENHAYVVVDKNASVDIGDMLWKDGLVAKPARWASGPAEFVEKFIGVSMQMSAAGVEHQVRVATGGVFEFDCPPSRFRHGDSVGPSVELPGVVLDQSVENNTSTEYSLGFVAREEKDLVSSVLVEIVPRFHKPTGSPLDD